MIQEGNKNYDVAYGVSSTPIVSTSFSASTKPVAFHGILCLAGTSTVSVRVYDSVNTATGNIIGIYSTVAGALINDNRFSPVIAKNGIYVVATGTDLEGSIFFAPKG